MRRAQITIKKCGVSDKKSSRRQGRSGILPRPARVWYNKAKSALRGLAAGRGENGKNRTRDGPGKGYFMEREWITLKVMK